MDCTEVEPRRTSEICVRCGLCCVMLRATCTEEEARRLTSHMGDPVERFAAPDAEIAAEVGAATLIVENEATTPEARELAQGIVDAGTPWVMKFPCTYLRGRPGKGVACAAYQGPRPGVCGSYLCKIAIQYKLSEITLAEGLHLISESFWKGDHSIFNWSRGSSQEIRLQLRAEAQDVAGKLRDEGVEQPLIDFCIAAQVTPIYRPRSDIDLSLMSMHFAVYDNHQANGLSRDGLLGLYFSEEEIEAMSDEERRWVSKGIRATLKELREYVEVGHA